MTPEEQTELVVLRCKTCNGDNQFSGPNGQAMVLHQSGCQKSEVERIPVVQRSAVEELVEGVGIAVRLLRAVSEGPYGDEARGHAKREADRLEAALAALTTAYPSLASPETGAE